MRHQLSHAFSQRSLTEQESLVATIIDNFMRQLEGKSFVDEVVDLTKWFNMMTFDITGDLAFGETFGGIESGKERDYIAEEVATNVLLRPDPPMDYTHHRSYDSGCFG